MTANNTEVVAWEVRTFSEPESELGVSSKYPEWAEWDENLNIMPLIHLSEYEALQAECEKLRKEPQLWTPIHMEVERRAEKMHCLQDLCDFEVTVMYEDYAATQENNT